MTPSCYSILRFYNTIFQFYLLKCQQKKKQINPKQPMLTQLDTKYLSPVQLFDTKYMITLKIKSQLFAQNNYVNPFVVQRAHIPIIFITVKEIKNKATYFHMLFELALYFVQKYQNDSFPKNKSCKDNKLQKQYPIFPNDERDLENKEEPHDSKCMRKAQVIQNQLISKCNENLAQSVSI
ncbi:unnamed protein product [Paramecium sonneborni]|uniref:Uncharacterized protein n=1 Tax=Paramecium sonneborni TaxID=65129 RepID=A0A8S1RK71_9CILI|nr:unnamed protein product [Paramecium sonneborni]